MRRSGFTLIELLIVIVIIALLAALLLPAIVGAICAAKETRAANLLAEVEGAAKIYERDYNVYPPTAADFKSGPCVNTLSQLGPKKQPYIEFVGEDLMAFPVTNASHLRNPVDITKSIMYRDNTLNPPLSGGPPVHNRYGCDLWAENCNAVATGINNWRASN
ncbi:MAG TPA: prepilin-type N-terminal cleavage/methylation domain-containing protein [Planctomycetota bacterium]|nr:prepilin-type N-terminal cleavage/methylation domain-containing protein [Planctomycetota bacterium]